MEQSSDENTSIVMEEMVDVILSIEFKERIQYFIPGLFEFIPFESKKWYEFQNGFAEKTRERYDLFIKKGSKPLPVRMSLFDYVCDADNIEENNEYRFLGFVNKVFEEIKMYFSIDEQKKLSNIIEKVLTNFDEQFLNYLGELLLINQVRKNSHELLVNEFPINPDIKKGTTMDFVVRLNESGQAYGMEVLNIQFVREFENDDDLVFHIERKLHEKVIDKSKNGVHNKFTLFPVFWCDFKMVNRISRLYKEKRINIDNTYEACVFVNDIYKEYTTHRFGLITTFFTSDGNYMHIDYKDNPE
jgi:hypothetical protein